MSLLFNQQEKIMRESENVFAIFLANCFMKLKLFELFESLSSIWDLATLDFQKRTEVKELAHVNN